MTIKNNEENPIEPEILAESIVRISQCMQRIEKNGLNEDAIIALVHDMVKLPKRNIREIIQAMAMLEKTYCTKGFKAK